MAKNIGLIFCERIQDRSCVGCAKCFKAVNNRTHAFADDEYRIVFKTGCGDCPGLVIPKIALQMTVLESLGEKVDEIFFSTCVRKAKTLMNCPMNLDLMIKHIEESTGLPVKVGTHEY